MAPLLIRSLLSSLVLLNFLLTISPTLEPSCTEGPSLPRDKPETIQSVPPINLLIIIERGLFFILPLYL